jgi:hypothetical protein
MISIFCFFFFPKICSTNGFENIINLYQKKNIYNQPLENIESKNTIFSFFSLDYIGRIQTITNSNPKPLNS